jgi:hypothetical protein
MIADIFVWHFTLCCFRRDHYQVNLSQCQALRCGVCMQLLILLAKSPGHPTERLAG